MKLSSSSESIVVKQSRPRNVQPVICRNLNSVPCSALSNFSLISFLSFGFPFFLFFFFAFSASFTTSVVFFIGFKVKSWDVAGFGGGAPRRPNVKRRCTSEGCSHRGDPF